MIRPRRAGRPAGPWTMSLALALTVAMTLAMAGAASAPLAAAAETVAAETAAAGAPVGPLATMQDAPPARDPGEVVGRVLRGDGSGLPHAWISYRTEDGAWALAQAGADVIVRADSSVAGTRVVQTPVITQLVKQFEIMKPLMQGMAGGLNDAGFAAVVPHLPHHTLHGDGVRRRHG